MTDPSLSIHFLGLDVSASGVDALAVVVVLALIAFGARWLRLI
jgi:hypothetical protein